MAPVEVEDLLEAYEHTINSILNFPCTIDDELLTRIHEEILNELLEVGGAHGLHTSGLRHQVLHLIQQAREKNRTRKFNFTAVDGTKIRGQYTSPIFEDCEVIGGSDNTKVLSDIRYWLCDFGDKYNKFQCENYGYFSAIGRSLDVIKSKLTVSTLMPDILRKSDMEVGSVWEHILDSKYYARVEPFKIRFRYHEPSDVSGQLSLSNDTINFSIKGVDLPCTMPKISPESELRAVFAGDIEYEIKKGVYMRPLAKVATLGLGFAFDAHKTVEKVHKVEMRMECKGNRVKLREKININISRDECDKFMEYYKKYEAVESIQYKEYRDQLSILEADAAAAVDFQEPWREFMQSMREGGPKAINELVLKKPTILKNLPKDINNSAGFAFEELMIARVTAEAQEQGVPLELYAGDGQGHFQFNGAAVRTPEYTDAVFYNRQTKRYYSVQFKCSDTPDNLVEMMSDNRETHIKKQSSEGTVPDAYLLDNVQLIGPRDVVDKLLDCSIYKITKERSLKRNVLLQKTAIGLATGAVIGEAVAEPTFIGELSNYAGYSTAGSTISAVGKYAGPAVTAGTVVHSGVGIINQWNAGDITTAEAQKAAGSLGIRTGLSIGGMVAVSSIGGLPGLAVGAALAITVGIGDYIFGDWFMSLFIEENPEEAKALIIRKQKQIVAEVLEAAYRLFDLTEHATDEEWRDAVRAARLKYHPDKGGDAEIFKAVEAAYSVIRAHRESG